MSGGKGGTTVQKIDPRLEEGGVQTLAAALRSASLPYSPNRGVTIASMSPQQLAAQRSANQAAGAYGLKVGDTTNYLPKPERNSMGIGGYSTGGLYDEGVAKSISPEGQDARTALLNSYARAATAVTPDDEFANAREKAMTFEDAKIYGNNGRISGSGGGK